MNLVTNWNPLREFEEMQDRVLRSFGLNRRTAGDQQALATSEWAPLVDIAEDEQEYVIKVELPEISRDDVKVTVENGMVTITGERRLDKETNNRKYHRLERNYGNFARAFALPEDAAPEKITADFKEGVLVVRLPKNEAKLPRRVEITVN